MQTFAGSSIIKLRSDYGREYFAFLDVKLMQLLVITNHVKASFKNHVHLLAIIV